MAFLQTFDCDREKEKEGILSDEKEPHQGLEQGRK